MGGRRTFFDWIVLGVFAFSAGLYVVAVVFGHRGVAICVGLMAGIVAFRASMWRAGLPLLNPANWPRGRLSVATAAMFGFCGYIALTSFWTPTPGAASLGAMTLVAALSSGVIAFEALRAPRANAKCYAVLFVLMVAIGALLLLFEGLSGGYLRDIVPPADASPLRWKDMTALGRGVTALAPLVFPAGVLIWRMTNSKIVAVMPALALLVAAMQFTIFSNVAALLAGALVFGLALAAPRASFAALAAASIALFVLTPFLALAIPPDFADRAAAGAIPPSWAQRLVVWRYAAARALTDCLPAGCGADAARAMWATAQTVRVPGWPVDMSVMPTHPHNLFMQVWLELGLPGVAALGGAAAAALAAFMKSRPGRLAFAAAAGSLGAIVISLMFEASIWQVWRLAVIAIAGYGCALTIRAEGMFAARD